MAGAAFTSRSEGGAVGALSNTGWVVSFGAPNGAVNVGEKGAASYRAPCDVSREFEYYE